VALGPSVLGAGMSDRKPVIAVQWTGVNFPAVCDFADPDRIRVDVPGEQLSLWVDKAKAWATVRVGDWVVADDDGAGFCPCPAAEFDGKAVE